jgi:hypothetical protein
MDVHVQGVSLFTTICIDVEPGYSGNWTEIQDTRMPMPSYENYQQFLSSILEDCTPKVFYVFRAPGSCRHRGYELASSRLEVRFSDQ